MDKRKLLKLISLTGSLFVMHVAVSRVVVSGC